MGFNPKILRITLTSTGTALIVTFLALLLANRADGSNYYYSIETIKEYCGTHKAWIFEHNPPDSREIHCGWRKETVVFGVISALTSLTFLVLFQCSRKITMKIPAIGLLGGTLLIVSAVFMIQDIGSGAPSRLVQPDAHSLQTPYIKAAIFLMISIVHVILAILLAFKKSQEAKEELPLGYVILQAIKGIGLSIISAAFIFTFLTIILENRTVQNHNWTEELATRHCADHKAWIFQQSPYFDAKINCGWSTVTVYFGVMSASTSLVFLIVSSFSKKFSKETRMKISAIGALGGLLLVILAALMSMDIASGGPGYIPVYEESFQSQAPFIVAAVFAVISLLDILLRTSWTFKKSKEVEGQGEQEEREALKETLQGQEPPREYTSL